MDRRVAPAHPDEVSVRVAPACAVRPRKDPKAFAKVRESVAVVVNCVSSRYRITVVKSGEGNIMRRSANGRTDREIPQGQIVVLKLDATTNENYVCEVL